MILHAKRLHDTHSLSHTSHVLCCIYTYIQGRENVAHTDQPLKEGNVHISAPHIYGSALEALELVPNSSMSFLNIGSGTGYVSCIVADILGSRSSHYGIEIHADVVQHSRAAIERWMTRTTTSSSSSPPPSIHIIHGNGLDVLPTKGESVFGFDRIYVGAAVERRNLNKLTRLLRPGGILVGPGAYHRLCVCVVWIVEYTHVKG